MRARIKEEPRLTTGLPDRIAEPALRPHIEAAMAWQDDASDLALVEHVARQIVAWRGYGAVAYLMEQAEIAEDLGDCGGARAWRDILGCAKDLLPRR